MRFSLYRSSPTTVIAKFHFTNDEMYFLSKDKNYLPKLKVAGDIAEGLTIWFEAKGYALRAISPTETVGVCQSSFIKARSISYGVREIEAKRVFEDGENRLRMAGIPELSEQFNPPRVVSKDMEIKQAPAPGARALPARPPMTGEALMRAEERMSAGWRKSAPEEARPLASKLVSAWTAQPDGTMQQTPIAREEPRTVREEPRTINGIADLVAAIGMVNEAAERLPEVKLFVHDNKITAKRERRSYEDLV